MAGEVPVTIIGTTTAPADLRFTASGHAVASFTVAVNPRRFDKQRNEWVEQPTQWYRCSVWREAAENAAETLSDKGMRVMVSGNLNPREYEKDGVKRMSLDVDVEELGVSLKWATAKVSRASRHSGGGGFGGSQERPGTGGQGAQADPWATGPGAYGGGHQATDEPPF
jgi:single-strand DNA-binding protein